MPTLVARRDLLQAGALTGGLALTGIHPQPAAAAPGRPLPITGRIAGHVRLNPMKGATIRLTELDHTGRAVRDLAFLGMPVTALYHGGAPTAGSAPLRIVCRQAGDIAVRVAAASWQVPSGTCSLSGRQIVHPSSGRSVGYSAWVDVV